tara:strand:- start:1296 stop:3347 length:2052 start_codon:yes stop_codon:yes gene_type:complete
MTVNMTNVQRASLQESDHLSARSSKPPMRDLRQVFAAGVVIWILVASVVTLILRADWNDLMARVDSTATTVSHLLADHSDRLLVNADLVRHEAELIVGTSGPIRADRSAYDDLRAMIDISPTIVSVWVGDADGQAVITTREFPAPDLNGAGRDYFTTIRNDPDRLYIGNLLVNQYDAEALMINTSRRLSNPDGSIRGFVQVSIDPRSISQTFQQVDLEFEASLWWIGPDGRALVREPALSSDQLSERMPRGSENWPKHDSGERETNVASVRMPIIGGPGADGGRRLYFWSDAPLYGSRIIIGVSYDAMVSRWIATSASTVGLGAIVGLACMAILSLLYRSRQRGLAYMARLENDVRARAGELAESEARLRLAIEAGDLAVWEVDLESDTIIGSPELNRLYGFPEDSTPTLDQLRSRYAPGELDRVRAESSEKFAQGESRLEFEIRHVWPDGTEKWLLMRAQIGRNRAGDGTRVVGVVADITESKKQEALLATVANELRHRLMNTITVISALASRSWPKEFAEEKKTFLSRLRAIGKSTDLMFSKDSEQGGSTLKRLLLDITEPYRSPEHDPFIFEGPDDVIVAGHVRPLAMAFHELCTNALKYGSLSVTDGRVAVRWCQQEDGSLEIDWQEMQGPPVKAPERSGLGSTLLTGLLFNNPSSVTINYDISGVTCTIVIREPRAAV